MELNVLFFHRNNVSQLSRTTFVTSTMVDELSQYPCFFPCLHLSLFLYFLVITWCADFRMLHFTAHTHFYMSQLLTFPDLTLPSCILRERDRSVLQTARLCSDWAAAHTHTKVLLTPSREPTLIEFQLKALHKWYLIPKGCFSLLQ